MKPSTRASAVKAAKYALIASTSFIVAPIVVHIASGIEVTGGLLAEKLVVGIAQFPIFFLIIWVYRLVRHSDAAGTGDTSSVQIVKDSGINSEATKNTPKRAQVSQAPDAEPIRASSWNYVAIAVGVSLLLFMFLPQVLSGTIATQHYLSAAFWVGVITYCVINIRNASNPKA